MIGSKPGLGLDFSSKLVVGNAKGKLENIASGVRPIA
jgi:hypothetical protein